MPPPLQPPANTSSVPPALNALIPKAVAPLRWEQFHDWTPEQKLLLQNVWKNIDGRHTIQDVKAGLPYPPQMVDDIVQILLTLRIIVLVS
jgi:hypothetical protein